MGRKVTTITKEYDPQGRVTKETIVEEDVIGTDKGNWEPVSPWRPGPYPQPHITWSNAL